MSTEYEADDPTQGVTALLEKYWPDMAEAVAEGAIKLHIDWKVNCWVLVRHVPTYEEIAYITSEGEILHDHPATI